MISNSIIYTFLFTMGLLLLIDSMHASAILKNNDHDDTVLSLKKRFADQNNEFQDEFQGFMLDNHQLASRGVRLPSESILLGKRRLPAESILLGKRRLPAESILLGKRRLPVEAVLLGRRNSLDEDISQRR